MALLNADILVLSVVVALAGVYRYRRVLFCCVIAAIISVLYYSDLVSNIYS